MAAARYSSDVLQMFYGPIPRVYADMAAERHSSYVQISEAIQNLPPELREMILKEYIAIRLKGKKEMGWDKVHKNILKLPLCKYREKIVPMVICFEYPDCYFEECCFPCFEKEGTFHKATINPPIIPLVEATPEYKNFLKECSRVGYDWHEWFLFGRER